MSVFGTGCILAVLASVLALLLKGDSPALGFLLTLAAGIVMLYRMMREFSGVMVQVRQVFEQGGMHEGLYGPVIKTMVVAVVVRIVGAMCRDAGQTGLAAKVEVVGAVTALMVSVPLLERLMQLIGGWML